MSYIKSFCCLFFIPGYWSWCNVKCKYQLQLEGKDTPSKHWEWIYRLHSSIWSINYDTMLFFYCVVVWRAGKEVMMVTSKPSVCILPRASARSIATLVTMSIPVPMSAWHDFRLDSVPWTALSDIAPVTGQTQTEAKLAEYKRYVSIRCWRYFLLIRFDYPASRMNVKLWRFNLCHVLYTNVIMKITAET